MQIMMTKERQQPEGKDLLSTYWDYLAKPKAGESLNDGEKLQQHRPKGVELVKKSKNH